MTELALQFLVPMALTWVWIIVFAPFARMLGLVDIPAGRKRHVGDIPVIGGIAIAMTLLAGVYMPPFSATFAALNTDIDVGLFVICGCYLVLVGAIDDKLHLGVKSRIFSELLFGVIVIEILGLQLNNLGNLIGLGEVSISGAAAYVFAIVAIFGIVNALNMLDGIDGLVASLLIATIVGFHVFTSIPPGLISLYLLGAVFAFLASNLGSIPFIPKTFLGDAGSKLIGFITVSLLIVIASDQIGGAKLIQPVTALFAVSIPLFDMVYVTLKRTLSRASPFSPGRDHIHHLLSNFGLSDIAVVATINLTHLIIMGLGFFLSTAGIGEPAQFALFVGLFLCYCSLINAGWTRISTSEN